jgi:HEAT repeat protein
MTSAGAGHLQGMPALTFLTVHVPRGTGKRIWELLAPLTNVAASGLRRPDGPALWVTSAAWEDTTAGLLERICSLVALKPEEEAILLDALAETCPGGVWKDPRTAMPQLSTPMVLAPPSPKAITAQDQLMEAMKGTDNESFNRVRLFAGSEAARSAVPALLKLLDEPKRKDSDYTVHHRAAFLLIRIAGADREVVAALARVLKSGDAQLRWLTVYAFNDVDAERAGKFGPKINAEQAEALLPLVLGCSKDRARDVRADTAQAMASIVCIHPKHAKAVVPVLFELFQDTDPFMSHYASNALGRIAKACPEQAGPIGAKLLAMLKGSSPQAEWRVVVETLGRVAPWDRETARAAAAALARALRGTNEPGARAVGDALRPIVQNHPEQLQTILPAILALLQDQDPARRKAAALALEGVATGVWERKTTEPPQAAAAK